MFRLIGIQGSVKGMRFVLKQGKTTIGRDEKNTICIASSDVSKFHCVLSFEKNTVSIEDAKSSHGTLVNGALIRFRVLKDQDHISIANCVFEFQEMLLEKPVSAQNFLPSLAIQKKEVIFSQQNDFSSEPELKGFEGIKKKTIDIFLKMNERYEWNFLSIAGLFFYVILCLLLMISPILEDFEKILQKEVMHRTRFLAQTLSETSSGALVSHNLNKVDFNYIENAPAVKLALITDLEGRILAPSQRATEYLETNPEAKILIDAKTQYLNGLEQGFCKRSDNSTITAIEPIKSYNAALGKNSVVALAIVSLDFDLTHLSSLQTMILYLQTAVTMLGLGFLFLWIGYQILLRRFFFIKEDLEKILRQDATGISRHQKIQECDAFLDLIDSLALRMGTASSSEQALTPEQLQQFVMEGLKPFIQDQVGFVLLDASHNTLQMNAFFSEISGIHFDNALGRDLPSVARDEAFGVFIKDVLGRLDPSSRHVQDEFDFSGIVYQVDALLFELLGSSCFAFVLKEKKE